MPGLGIRDPGTGSRTRLVPLLRANGEHGSPSALGLRNRRTCRPSNRHPGSRPRLPSAHVPVRRRHTAPAGDASALLLREDRRRAVTTSARSASSPRCAGSIAAATEASIVAEARALAAAAPRNCCSSRRTPSFYGVDRGERGALAGCFATLNRVDGLEWIRMLYLYPTTITDDVLDADRREREGLQVHRPAAAACLERGAETHEASGHAGQLRAAARPHPATAARRHPADHVHRRLSGRNAGGCRGTAAASSRPCGSTMSGCSPTRTRKARPGLRSRTMCRRPRSGGDVAELMSLQKRIVTTRPAGPPRSRRSACWSTGPRPSTTSC